MTEVLSTIPPTQEIGLMAYGHREKGNCSDIELMVSPAAGTGAEIAARVNQMRFQGKTPLSESVRQAAEALRFGEEPATVVLVTDGLETCEADPCALARELEAAGLDFTAHVIGFGLSRAEGAQVACLATETGGQYLQASDAGALRDALSATVKAELPPPQPLPEPEPEPVLPKAALTAPDSAPAGSVLRVGFEGPHEEFDYIRVLDANGDWQSEAAVGEEPFVDLRLPFDLGAYELAYLYRATDIIARQPLQVTEAVVSLTAPETAPAGSTISVDWTGPGAEYDYVTLLDGAGQKRAEVSLGDSSPVELGLPWATGDFTLNYFFQSEDVIFSRPITLTEAPVSITAPAKAQVGTAVTITWQGPRATYDNIQLWQMGGDRIEYQYLDATNQLTFTLPETPGDYEFRYVFGDTEVIHTTPIALVTEAVEPAPEAAPEVQPVPISFTGQGTDALPLAVSWSATPVAGQDLPPEAWALPDTVTGPVTADFLPGTYDVLGQAGDTVFAGQVTVTSEGPNSFVIPVSASLSPAGEDAAPVPVTITGPYMGTLRQWSAIPLTEGPALQSAGEINEPWAVTLTPGPWLITAKAFGAEGEGLASVVQISAAGEVEIGQPTFSTAPISDQPPFHRECQGTDPCSFHDSISGLRALLLPGWLLQDPYPMTTASGESSGLPSTLFGTRGTGDTPLAALNPRQWDASLGPCETTAAGQLCRLAEMPDEALSGYRALAASLRVTGIAEGTSDPALPPPIGLVGEPMTLDADTATTLRNRLLGQN